MTRTTIHGYKFEIRHDAESHWAVCLLDSRPWCGPHVGDAAVAGYSGAAHFRIQTGIDRFDLIDQKR